MPARKRLLMRMRDTTVHAIFLLLLPLAVAAFGLSLPTAALLVVLALAWRWALSFRRLRSSGGPDLVLEGIGLSHYVEKVRWCMDRLDLEYSERVNAATLGAFYRGRTVPLLDFKTGTVRSTIGNSAEILRYLWGVHGATQPRRAAFLEPTPARLELEARIDRYGRHLQVWIYSHLLDHRTIMLDAWGSHDPRVPAVERLLIRLLYPVQAFLIRRAFRITPGHYEKARGRINELLAEVDAAVAATPTSILGDTEPNYTDFAFAALSSAWLLPDNFAGRDQPVLEFDTLPEPMRADIEAFRQQWPAATDFITRLYRDERQRTGDTE